MEHVNEDLVVDPTDDTPFVLMSTNGEIKIEGKSLPEDTKKFYDPLINWVETNIGSPEKVIIDFKLYYFNTSSSKQIYALLSMVKAKAGTSDIEVNWHYEEGDDEVLDSGTHFESLTELNFNFIEVPEEL